MSAEKDVQTGVSPPSSLEAAGGDRRPSTQVAGMQGVPHNLRETDWATRNGLSLKSFQRRELHLCSEDFTLSNIRR